MSNAITWDYDALESEAERKINSLKWIGRVIIGALALILVAGVVNFLARFARFDTPDGSVERVADWVLFCASIGGCIGMTVLLRMLLRFRAWQGECQKELSGQLKNGEKQWASASLTFRNQIAEIRQAEERLQKQNAELGERNAALQGELDKRKVSEKNLHDQRRELVRSKDVLEIHVQERTHEIQKLQHRYELILNSAGDGICGLDMNGKATFVNPAAARMTGWEVKELIGRAEHEIFGTSAVTAEPESDDGTKPKDQAFRRRDGSMFLAELNKTPLLENGREMGAVLVFKDITERRQSEEALAEKAEELTRSNAELEQFAFVASHDLQEPLRKIQAFGDRLKTKCEKIELGEGRDYLDRMQNAAARMQTLINDLLAFSRVIRSSQPFVPVDLARITKEVLNDLEVRIEKNGAKVEVGELPTIDADPTQMRQLIQNLLSNALKFQPKDAQPVVKITSRKIATPQWNHASDGDTAAAPENSLCEISFTDNGIGFDEKHLEKIFAVFQRLHGRTEYEGTGVGLAVCRRIADRHGGSITAKSQPGKGATFVVTLPIHPPPPENPK